jgi:hypothetical protein
MVTEDRAAELASIARLGDLRFESAVFGHGRAISREAAQRFREFAARVQRRSAGAQRSLLDRQLRPPEGCDCGWQDALVVALQIRGVSEPTRRTLSAEARACGESLQEYLLDLLDREARAIDSRRLLAEWTAGPSGNGPRPISFAELIRSERESQGSSLSSKLG